MAEEKEELIVARRSKPGIRKVWLVGSSSSIENACFLVSERPEDFWRFRRERSIILVWVLVDVKVEIPVRVAVADFIFFMTLVMRNSVSESEESESGGRKLLPSSTKKERVSRISRRLPGFLLRFDKGPPRVGLYWDLGLSLTMKGLSSSSLSPRLSVR